MVQQKYESVLSGEMGLLFTHTKSYEKYISENN